MMAIVHDGYGERTVVLRLDGIGKPDLGDDEVLLRVHAAGVDRGVWHLMAGLPYRCASPATGSAPRRTVSAGNIKRRAR